MTDRHEAPRCASSQPLTEAERDRSARILARTLYRELRANGYSQQQIITVAEELLDRARTEPDVERST